MKNESTYQACKDGQTNVDVAVYQGHELQMTCGTLNMTYGLEQADQIYTFICSTNGDTVLLSKSSGKIVVYEIVVLGHITIPIPGTLLSLRKHF